MNPIIYAAIVAAVLLFWGICIYNRLVRADERKNEGWSGVSVQLKRRHDLIPNLVATAKGLAGHEKELLTSVTQARAAAENAASPEKIAQAEGQLNQALRRFLAVAENYPTIKADSAFTKLMDELSATEEDLQLARRYYNGTVRDFNMMVRSFPTVLIAGMLGFNKAQFFELESPAEAEAPKVDF